MGIRSAHSWTQWRRPFQQFQSKTLWASFTPRKAATASVSVTLLASTGGVLAFATISALKPAEPSTSAPADKSGPAQGQNHDHNPHSLPTFRLSEVRSHDAHHANPWVISGNAVYDITDWIDAHPGGPIILRAAGGSIDPYWDIFSVHKSHPYVREILNQYLIGHIAPEELDEQGRPRCLDAAGVMDDPFKLDPKRDARLVQHTTQPCNAETPAEKLVDSYLTPVELFYVRNHMWVPTLATPANSVEDSMQSKDAESTEEHNLTIELPSGMTRTYTMADLQAPGRFRRATVTATLQCAGNRRSHMTEGTGKQTKGLQWDVGAISTAQWEGVWLRDVLRDAGLRWDDEVSAMNSESGASADSDPEDTLTPMHERQHHVHLHGLESYSASIPLPTALDPRSDVLLAFGMNGGALPRDHGFPLRAVVPGHVAARSVKWLGRVVVAPEESTSQWQRRDYKCFGPNQAGREDWDAAPAIQEMPITSAVARVVVGGGGGHDRPAAAVSGGEKAARDENANSSVPLAVTGYAYSGGGREIVRVDVSLDGGRTWDQATLLDDCGDGGGDGERNPSHCQGHKAWAWKRWRYDGTFPATKMTASAGVAGVDGKGRQSGGAGGDELTRCTTIVVKATDDAYNSQPETHTDIYNVRGNLATAWHRVKVCMNEGGGCRQLDKR